MDLRFACCTCGKSSRTRVRAQADAISAVRGADAISAVSGPRWWAAGLAPVATSLLALVAVAAPATGATSRSSVAAFAGASEIRDGTADLSASPALETATEGAMTPSPQAPDPGTTASGAQSEPDVAEAAPDIAQTGAVSPAIAHGQVVEAPEQPAVTATNTAPPPATQPTETGVTSGIGSAGGEIAPAAAGRLVAPLAQARVTNRVAVKSRDRVAPNGWRYRSAENRYRSKEAIGNRTREVAVISAPKVHVNVPQSREVKPQSICAEISCESAIATPPTAAPPATSETVDPTVDPGDEELIDGLLGQIGGGDECGNTNVSFRVSSPGDDAGVSQAAAPGECGRNMVVTIRINSPGDNGAVTQIVGTMDAIMSRFSSLLRASRQRQMRPEQAGSQPGYPYLGVNPATLPGRLERSARRLAWSLVAQAQARANRALPKAAPRRARERSRSSVRVSAYASSSAGRARVTASARVSIKSGRVSIKTSHRTKRARGTSTGTSLTVPRSRENRLTASPRLLPEAQSGSDSGRGAILIALLAALVGAYLLVPPFRSAHALGLSRFWPRRGEPPQ